MISVLPSLFLHSSFSLLFLFSSFFHYLSFFFLSSFSLLPSSFSLVTFFFLFSFFLPRQGLILSGLCGSTVPVYMISKAGHLPMRKQDGQDFVTLINDAYVNARPIIENASDFLNSLPVTKSGGVFGTDLRSYFSTECTLNNMIKFYDFILSERRNSLSPLQRCLECPNVVNIDGDKISVTGHHFQISDKAIQSTINKHFVQSEKSQDSAVLLDKHK